jgi:ABC-2 type transport system ATP-binding protein
MIEIKALSKRFGNQWALKSNTWAVQDKKTLGLLGPNGAGKSTTMKIMTGLLCSTEGQVRINGEDILDHPVEAKRQIGYLPETPPLYEDLKVYDFLDFICGLRSVERSQRGQQIDGVIEKLQLHEYAFRPIRVLSKGFRQRVGIAQALIGDPPILILDEPSVGLDPHQVVELRNIIKALKQDHIIVLSTHVLSEVEEVCDQVVILHKGEVRAQGDLHKLVEQHQKKNLEEVFIEVTR